MRKPPMKDVKEGYGLAVMNKGSKRKKIKLDKMDGTQTEMEKEGEGEKEGDSDGEEEKEQGEEEGESN